MINDKQELSPLGRRHETFASYKRQAISAAKDLLYSKEVQKYLKYAKTEEEITHIMREARREKMK